jgi:ubiquinone/menaquinone biosynthesis C-methylase UbiE
LTWDKRRAATWRALWRYHFRFRIRPDDTVLDLGAGYGDFINSVTAAKRIAIDSWPGMADHLKPDVRAIIGPVTNLDELSDASVDFAFASNLFEHLTQDDLIAVLKQLSRKLRPGGELSILQPNYRYAYREYFDDYTHRTPYSHIGLADLLRAQGWIVTQVAPRFLPLTIKSRLPTWDWLVGAYLRSPFKPLGKQMMISARPSH